MSVGILAGNVRSFTILQATVDLGSVAANTTEEEDATLTGVLPGDIVIPIKPSLEAGIAVTQARVDEANSIKITVVNATGSAVDASSETYSFLVARPESTDNLPGEVLK